MASEQAKRASSAPQAAAVPQARSGGATAAPRAGSVLLMILAVLAAEFLAMAVIEARLSDADLREAAFESVVSVILLFPVLYALFMRPTLRNLRRRTEAERALFEAHASLETRVRERTAELEDVNARLLREITEGVARRQAMELQAALLDAVEQAVVVVDAGGSILYWNRFAERLYGWTRRQAEGASLSQVVAWAADDGRPLPGPVGAGDSAGGWSAEVVARGADGVGFPAHLACSPLAEGRYILVSFDISRRRRAEDALRRSQATHASLVNSSPTGILIFRRGRLLFGNPALAQMLDELPEGLVGRPLESLFEPLDCGRVSELMEAPGGVEPISGELECRLRTRSQEVRWVAMRYTQIELEAGPAVLATVQDVTEHRRMEGELRSLSARLLGIQEEERRRLALELHDGVGQTLTGLKFRVEAALGTPWPGDRRSGTARLQALVPAIQDAVEEVRRISTELRPSILDDLGLLPTIAWCLRGFQAAHPGIAVEQRVDAEEADVPDDLRAPIYRILQEATNNVAKHAAASRLEVAFEAAGAQLRLVVRDDGLGFDPHGPPEADRRGLGLTSMHERASLSGGAFSLDSGPGRGTTVEVLWQRRRPEDRAPSGPAAASG